MPIQNLDDTAKQILSAATKRFLHYGYGKTTMSEIAGDCNMSTGNVYRYFPSKLDLAETFVRVLREEQMDKLRAVARSGASPQERLRALLKLKFKLSYERYHNRPKAQEMALAILKERPQFAVDWEDAENEIIAEVLTAGAEAGVFEHRDQLRLARIIQDVIYRFTSPDVILEGEYEMLASELDEVIDLVMDAFSCRNARHGDDHTTAL
ncbi:MAG TPA: TetR/AcrR family transcriptional regulator [Amphiplicatus sp.]|nr:TetR/AcrR family transcriptional regulator [Amphiplicatus sp.]